MKKVIAYVRIALHFSKMTVLEVLPFAKGIKAKILIDPDIHIDPAVQLDLDNAITALDGTVTLRETDKSTALTATEGQQVSDLIIIIEDIAQTTEKQANAQTPGVVLTIESKILRIGFLLAKAGIKAGRFFEIFKMFIGKVAIRVKKDKTFNLYHWCWSLDEITWTRISDTTVASIVIFGLPSGKRVHFKSAQTLKVKGVPQIDANNNEPDWSDSISEMIP
jgi:hypothetical protein